MAIQPLGHDHRMCIPLTTPFQALMAAALQRNQGTAAPPSKHIKYSHQCLHLHSCLQHLSSRLQTVQLSVWHYIGVSLA